MELTQSNCTQLLLVSSMIAFGLLGPIIEALPFSGALTIAFMLAWLPGSLLLGDHLARRR